MSVALINNPFNNLCLLDGDVLLPSSIVSDDKSSHTSPRRISSLIPLLIFSQRLLHFVVFGISILQSYNQRFFQSEIDIFLYVCLNPPCLPGYNVARLPGCSLISNECVGFLNAGNVRRNRPKV